MGAIQWRRSIINVGVLVQAIPFLLSSISSSGLPTAVSGQSPLMLSQAGKIKLLPKNL